MNHGREKKKKKVGQLKKNELTFLKWNFTNKQKKTIKEELKEKIVDKNENKEGNKENVKD